MASRGVLFAILPSTMERLLEARTDEALLSIIQDEIEEKWDKGWLYQTDKAWDAIHRTLTDGRLGFDNGTFPLTAAILGGEQLYRGDDYIVSLVRPDAVGAVASELAAIDRERFCRGVLENREVRLPGRSQRGRLRVHLELV
jgi:hypothetical protein